MATPLMSVVLPVRDEARWVDGALRSLRRQTLTGIEIIVVDDGSTDATPARVAEHARADRRIRVLQGSGTGLIDALHHGIEHARSGLIARMDADDLAVPKRLARQLAELERNPAAVAVGTYGWRINERGLPIGRLRTGPASPAAYEEVRAQGRILHLTHPSVVFRADAFAAVGGYDPSYDRAEDLRLFNDLAARGQVYALPEELLHYRVRVGSASGADLGRQELQTARIEHEVATGRRFPSLEAFTAQLAAEHPGELLRLQHAARTTAAQRRLARALANGRLRQSVELVRHELPPGMLRTIGRRAVVGG